MHWNILEDTLTFKSERDKDNNNTVTKRRILSRISSIYDPLGLLSPITVRAKIILRKLWTAPRCIGWDDLVPDEVLKEWNSLNEDLKRVNEIQIYRSLTPGKVLGRPTLILFSDGSPQAYGAVAYCRWKTVEEGYVTRIIAAKSRVAPLKTINIVRLELCGAVISKRLRESISHELTIEFERTIHLVDGEIVKAMINLK